jgi:hypothetical protein
MAGAHHYHFVIWPVVARRALLSQYLSKSRLELRSPPVRKHSWMYVTCTHSLEANSHQEQQVLLISGNSEEQKA